MRAVVKELGDRDLLLAGARAEMERALREKHDAEQMLAKVIPPTHNSFSHYTIYICRKKIFYIYLSIMYIFIYVLAAGGDQWAC